MNNDPKFIHETAVKEIIDTIDAIKDLSPDDVLNMKKKGTMSYSSIAKASSNLTMVFPVMCSRNIDITRSSIVSKALEKRFVTMLQMIFSSAQIMNSDIKSVQDYINQFHGNISTRIADFDDLFNYTEQTDAVKELAVKQDMRNIDHRLPSDVSDHSISEMFSVSEGAIGKVVDNTGAMSFEPYAYTNGNKMHSNGDLNRNRNSVIKDRVDYFTKQVQDNDFKKANELMPTTMYINFTVIPDGGGEPIKVQDGVVGVKAKLYPLSSDDIINHLVDKEQDKNWVTNFIRATTREISFFKDFLFAIDKAKIDAMSLSDRRKTSDKMWKVLERRSTNSKIKRAMRQTNNMASITTLIISQEEVEYLRKNYNVDMERISSVINLFTNLNLIAFVIVDESLEVAKFIFDEQDPSWETISFNHLERESNDNTYKKVVNLMSKMR